jgi:hypothetical protein
MEGSHRLVIGAGAVHVDRVDLTLVLPATVLPLRKWQIDSYALTTDLPALAADFLLGS